MFERRWRPNQTLGRGLKFGLSLHLLSNMCIGFNSDFTHMGKYTVKIKVSVAGEQQLEAIISPLINI